MHDNIYVCMYRLPVYMASYRFFCCTKLCYICYFLLDNYGKTLKSTVLKNKECTDEDSFTLGTEAGMNITWHLP